jgi:hypothetical protein
MENPMAFAASSNPDVMYLDQAMKEPDREKFEEAMLEEVRAHTENGHWIIENICNSGKTSKLVDFFLVEKPVVILENICKCFLVDFFVTAPVFQTEIAWRPVAMSQTTRTSST